MSDIDNDIRIILIQKEFGLKLNILGDKSNSLLNVVDMLGQIVYQNKTTDNIIDINLSKGLFILDMSIDGKKFVKKVLIK